MFAIIFFSVGVSFGCSLVKSVSKFPTSVFDRCEKKRGNLKQQQQQHQQLKTGSVGKRLIAERDVVGLIPEAGPIIGLQPRDKAAMLGVNTIAFFSQRIYVKIEFSSQRREILLFLTTNMAAVTSRKKHAITEKWKYTFCCSLRENTHSFVWNGDQQREDTFISAKKRTFAPKSDSITIFAF